MKYTLKTAAVAITAMCVAAVLLTVHCILLTAEEVPSTPFQLPKVESAPEDSSGSVEETKEQAAAGEESEKEDDKIMVTAVSRLNVRKEPDGTSEIFAVAEKGTVFEVLGMQGDWIGIEYEGRGGYIYKGNVEGLPEEENEESGEATKKVTIFSSRWETTEIGKKIYLTSVLEGFEDCEEIYYQWMCDLGDGFFPVKNSSAQQDEYSFTATEENLHSRWKLVVSYR